MKLLNECEINLVTGAWCVCLTTENYNALKPSENLTASSDGASFEACAAVCCLDFPYFVFAQETGAKLEKAVKDKTTWHRCNSRKAKDAFTTHFMLFAIGLDLQYNIQYK